MSGDDPDLREYFAAVRQEEEARVPPMSKFVRRAQGLGRKNLSGRLTIAATGVAMTFAAALWLLPGSRAPQEELNRGRERAASITTWKPATDFLLDTPGREVLQAVPAIGEWPGAATSTDGGVKHRHVSKQVVP